MSNSDIFLSQKINYRIVMVIFCLMIIWVLSAANKVNAVTIPISLNEKKSVENLDLAIQFNPDNLEVANISLSGGILDSDSYIYDYSVVGGKLLIVVYASGDIITAQGNAVFVIFNVKNTTPTTITLSKFECNEQPANGSFNYNGQLTKDLHLIFNRSPILNIIPDPKLDPINQNNFSSNGNTVKDIIIDGSITDEDGFISKSIAVISVDQTNGIWQYSSADEIKWNNFSDDTGGLVDLSDKARLLDDGYRIRFVPNINWSGTASFRFRAWDKTVGVSGETADARTFGIASAFSEAFDAASIDVLLFKANAGPDQNVFETETVTLDCSLSSGVIKTYRWQQIGGIPVSLSYSMAMMPWFIVPQISSGNMTFTFMLTIEDSSGVTSTDTVTITASNYPSPIADFQALPVSGNVPLNVAFTDLSQGKIDQWEWDFGDGVKSLLKNPVHTYAVSGTYNVKLTVKGPGGESVKLKPGLITVIKVPLKSDFTASPLTGAAPLTVSFLPMIQGETTEWLWNFGNGSTSSQKNPIHVYSSPGVYDVSLTIKGPEGIQTEYKKGFITVIERSVSGKVMAADTGSPLENSWVEVWNGNVFLKGVYTGTDGSYRINQLPASDNLIVFASPPDQSVYDSQYYNKKETRTQADRISLVNSSLLDIDFFLPKQPIEGISGRVHDGQKGISGIRVTAFSKSLSFGKSAITDGVGTYTITGLKPANDYRVSAWSDTLNTEFYYAIPNNEAVGTYIPTTSVFQDYRATLLTPKFPFVQNIDIIINVNQGATIEGYVFDADQMNPVKGVWVNAWSESLNIGSRAMTDDSGRYIIFGLDEVAPADASAKGYIVEIIPSEFAYQAYDRSDSKQNATRVSTGKSGIDFYLKRMRSVSGCVMDVKGNPVSGVVIAARSLSSPTAKKGETVSDEAGKWSINLPIASDYIIQALPAKYSAQYYHMKTDTSQADLVNNAYGNVENINFVLNKGGIIKGQIFIGNAPAPAGIIVNVWSEQTRSGGDSATDTQGRYQIIGLNPSAIDYVISIRHSGYVPVFYHSNGTVYELKNAERVSPSDTEDRNLTMITGYSIKGKITFNGEPVSGVRLEALKESNTISLGSTGLDGYYSITGLLSGKYDVTILPLYFMSQTKTVDIQTSDVMVDFALVEEPDRSISGVISGLDPDKTITIIASSQSKKVVKSIQIQTLSDIENYIINGLKPAPDYMVEFVSSDYLYQVYRDSYRVENATYVNLNTSNADHIDFTAKRKNITISGNVIFPADAVSGESARVNVFSRAVGFSAFTDAVVGASKTVPFSITGLAPSDDYLVYVSSDKFLSFYYNGTDIGVFSEQEAVRLNTIQNPAIVLNINLSRGASISGKITDSTGKGVSNLTIEAYSPNTGSTSIAITSDEGIYHIQGLRPAGDYIVSVKDPNIGTLFYNNNNAVRDQFLATPVNIITGKADHINIQIVPMESISGMITDMEGNPLHLMWVQADSKLASIRQGFFTDLNGYYEIKGLFPSRDYTVSARPNWFTEPHEKYHVASGSTGINFRLNPNEGYFITGVVADPAGKPVPGVRVEIWSEIYNIKGNLWSVTDAFGKYELRGIPSSNDYTMMAFPLIGTPYAFYYEKQISVPASGNIKNIQLSPGLTISGKVTRKKDGLPIPFAQIVAISKLKNFYGKAITASDGSYKIFNVPDTSDYDITVMSGSTYLGQTLSGLSPITEINFSLDDIGFISGEVRDRITGSPLPNVMVEAVSESMKGVSGFFGSAMTDQNGVFTIRGLKTENSRGDTLADYTVRAISSVYPAKSKSNRKVGDVVTFILEKGNHLSGTIVGIDGYFPKGTNCLAEAFEDNGTFAGSVWADGSGNFKFTTLDADKKYLIKITAYIGNEERLIQWAGADDSGYAIGVDNPVDLHDQPSEAKQFNTDINIRFKFSKDIFTSSVRSSPGPGKVRNLETTTHRFTRSTEISILSSSHTDVVSNNPYITVTWDSSDSSEQGYYFIFDRDANTVITKRNAPAMPPIQFRQTTSGKLTGDNVSYYFHIAAVDNRGRIGPTVTREFRIDTVPPSDGIVMGPETSFTQTITLTLGAADAKEMYLSNITYVQGGIWESRVKEKLWQMTEGDGPKKIYVQLRDEAGNTANYLVSVEKKPLKGTAIPVIKDQMFSVNENSPIGTNVGKVASTYPDASANLTFSIIAGSEGLFTINSASGEISVAGNIDFEKQNSYSMIVEVSDGKNKAQATVVISIKDVLEVEPQTFIIDKDTEPETIIGEIIANGPIKQLTYTILSGNTDNMFSIINGKIKLNKKLDFKTTPKYDLSVRITDGVTTVTVSIIIELSEDKLIVNTQTFTVDSNSENGTFVGKVKATSPNPNLMFEIISGNIGNVFAIHPLTGEITVNNRTQFDFNKMPRYELIIKVTDGKNTVEAKIIIPLQKQAPLADIRWVIEPIAPMKNSVEWFKCIIGNSRSEVFITGGGYNYSDQKYYQVVLQNKDNHWRRITGMGNEFLYQARFDTSENGAFAVGWNGTLLYYDGTIWSQMNSPTSEHLMSLAVIDSNSTNENGDHPSNIYAVGHSGTILRFDGVNWIPITKTVSKDLYDIWGTSDSDIFAVGDNGVILHFNGIEWYAMDSPTNKTLRGIWGDSRTNVFAVGDNGVILHFDGVEWKGMESFSTESLYDIIGIKDTGIFVVGDAGTILYYDGTKWSRIISNTRKNLKGIWGNSETIFCVGDGGTILKTGK